MSDEHLQPLHDPDGDSELDALLARAMWPEPAPDSSRRLLDFWWQVTPARRPWEAKLVTSRWAAGAAAAVVLMAILAGWQAAERKRRGQPSPRPVALLPDRAISTATTPVDNNQPPALPPVPTVSLTPIQVTLLAIQPPRQKVAASSAVRGRDIDATVERVLGGIAGDPSDAATRRAAGELAPFARFEARVQHAALSDRGPWRLAALRLLSFTGSQACLRLLSAAWADPKTHDAALRGVARLAGPDTLASFISQPATSPADQMVFLRALQQRDPAVSVPIYIALLHSLRTSEAGYAALHDVPASFVEQLFAALDDPRVDVRLAAARALGRIDGAATTARLVNMAEAKQNRREALIALACSNGSEARAFLDRAGAGSDYAGAVRSIQLQFHR